MRALVYKGIKDLSLEEVQAPSCPSDGILIRVKVCGFCGTDLRTYHSGHRHINPPWIIGHEISGEVVEVGAKVNGYKVGDRLAVAPPVYCGRCHFCRKGLYYLCDNYREIGQHWPGGFAEFMVIPPEALRLGNVNIIPEELSYEEAAISEPPSSCINAQENAQVTKGDTVVIMGAGPVGCFHLQIARAREASKVAILDILEKRLQLAKRFSPDLVIDNSKDGYIKKVMEATDNLGPDVVIVACPSAKAQVDSLKMVKKGGRVIFFGGLPHHKSQVFLDTNLIHYKGLHVFGLTSFSPKHNRKALKLILEGKIQAKKCITHIFSLEDFERAIRVTEQGEALKVVLRS